MSINLFTNIDIEFTDTTGLPRVIDYRSYFASQASLLGWFDFAQADTVTEFSGGISAVSARYGALSMIQQTVGNRPTYANGRAVFDKTASQFLTGVGDHPASAVTVAAILRHAATPAVVEGLFGSTSPSTGSHAIFWQANGELRYRVTDGTLSTFQEPATPTLPLNTPVLVIASYDQATDQALCRINNGAGNGGLVAAGDITMNPTWFVGALTSAGDSPASFELDDLFVFDAALIETEVHAMLLGYAKDIKGVA